jgi:hypothetical protein
MPRRRAMEERTDAGSKTVPSMALDLTTSAVRFSNAASERKRNPSPSMRPRRRPWRCRTSKSVGISWGHTVMGSGRLLLIFTLRPNASIHKINNQRPDPVGSQHLRVRPGWPAPKYNNTRPDPLDRRSSTLPLNGRRIVTLWGKYFRPVFFCGKKVVIGAVKAVNEARECAAQKNLLTRQCRMTDF